MTIKGGRAKKEKESVTGSSLAVLLTQGLMANDPAKVDTVLQTADLVVIKSTLEEINVIHVLPLLQAVEHRLRSRRAQNIRCWIRWLQCTLTFHMSYLSSQRDLNHTIGGLMEWLKSRSLHQQKLFQLHGKISTLSDQVERRFNKTSAMHTYQPLIVFNNDQVDDTDIDELESLGSEGSEASSNEAWWDEGDIKQNEDDDEKEESEEDDYDEDKENQHPMENKESEDDDEDDDDEDESDMEE